MTKNSQGQISYKEGRGSLLQPVATIPLSVSPETSEFQPRGQGSLASSSFRSLKQGLSSALETAAPQYICCVYVPQSSL